MKESGSAFDCDVLIPPSGDIVSMTDPGLFRKHGSPLLTINYELFTLLNPFGKFCKNKSI